MRGRRRRAIARECKRLQNQSGQFQEALGISKPGKIREIAISTAEFGSPCPSLSSAPCSPQTTRRNALHVPTYGHASDAEEASPNCALPLQFHPPVPPTHDHHPPCRDQQRLPRTLPRLLDPEPAEAQTRRRARGVRQPRRCHARHLAAPPPHSFPATCGTAERASRSFAAAMMIACSWKRTGPGHPHHFPPPLASDRARFLAPSRRAGLEGSATRRAPRRIVCARDKSGRCQKRSAGYADSWPSLKEGLAES